MSTPLPASIPKAKRASNFPDPDAQQALTLRDYLAGQVLGGICSPSGVAGALAHNPSQLPGVTAMCYALADQFIAERDRQAEEVAKAEKLKLEKPNAPKS